MLRQGAEEPRQGHKNTWERLGLNAQLWLEPEHPTARAGEVLGKYLRGLKTGSGLLFFPGKGPQETTTALPSSSRPAGQGPSCLDATAAMAATTAKRRPPFSSREGSGRRAHSNAAATWGKEWKKRRRARRQPYFGRWDRSARGLLPGPSLRAVPCRPALGSDAPSGAVPASAVSGAPRGAAVPAVFGPPQLFCPSVNMSVCYWAHLKYPKLIDICRTRGERWHNCHGHCRDGVITPHRTQHLSLCPPCGFVPHPLQLLPRSIALLCVTEIQEKPNVVPFPQAEWFLGWILVKYCCNAYPLTYFFLQGNFFPRKQAFDNKLHWSYGKCHSLSKPVCSVQGSC